MGLAHLRLLTNYLQSSVAGDSATWYYASDHAGVPTTRQF